LSDNPSEAVANIPAAISKKALESLSLIRSTEGPTAKNQAIREALGKIIQAANAAPDKTTLQLPGFIKNGKPDMALSPLEIAALQSALVDAQASLTLQAQYGASVHIE